MMCALLRSRLPGELSLFPLSRFFFTGCPELQPGGAPFLFRLLALDRLFEGEQPHLLHLLHVLHREHLLQVPARKSPRSKSTSAALAACSAEAPAPGTSGPAHRTTSSSASPAALGEG